jgi:hypothetical protein
MRIDLRDLSLSISEYSDSENPPVLHRKETFVSAKYPGHSTFASLTEQEEAAGLLTDTKNIGTRRAWLARLQERGMKIEDHVLHINGVPSAPPPLAKKDSVEPPVSMAPVSTAPASTKSVALEKQSTSERNEVQTMSIEELKKFITKQMSISHSYQPGIMIALIEGGGRSTVKQAAEKCAQLESKPAAPFEAALKKYPLRALQNRQIVRVEGDDIELLTDALSDDVRSELIELCRTRYGSKAGR